MPASDPPLLVTLANGASATRFVRFSPGQPATTITVGLDGNWPVAAVGMARAHVSLFFDGKELFVSTLLPGLHASINGTAIDGRKWPLRPPAELRVGQAAFRVTVDTGSVRPDAAPPKAFPSAPPGMAHSGPSHARTALDGVGQWELRRRSDAPVDPSKTQLYDPRTQGAQAGSPVVQPAPGTPRGNPKGAPTDEVPMVSTLRQPLAANPADQVRLVNVPAASPVRPSAPPPTAPDPAFPAPAHAHPNIQHPSAPPVHAGHPYALPPSVPPPNIAADARAAALQARTALAPLAHVRPGGEPPGRSPRPRSSEPPKKRTPKTALKRMEGFYAAWRSASLVKKTTVVLLPFAVVAVLLPEPTPASRPTPSARASSSASKAIAAAPASSTAGTPTKTAATTSAAATELPAASSSPAPPAQPGAPPPDRATATRTTDVMEHAAIEAAFEGRWEDALTHYSRLATAHPDVPAFGEAARIVRETKVRH